LASSQLSSHSGHRSRGIEVSDWDGFGDVPLVLLDTMAAMTMRAITESVEKCDNPSAPASRSRGEPTSSGGRSSTRRSHAARLRTPHTSKRGPTPAPGTATCGTDLGTMRLASRSSLFTTGRRLPASPAADAIAHLSRRQFVLFATTHDVGHSGATVLHSRIERWGR
jgi:hypothetical protein